MERSKFQKPCLFISVLIFMLNMSQVMSAITFLSVPGLLTVGYRGKAVNFTWRFSGASGFEELVFRTKENQNKLSDLIAVTKIWGGKFDVRKIDKEYQRRIKWIGSVPSGLAKFELSDISLEDDGQIFELRVGDDEKYTLWNKTVLAVKEASKFTYSRDFVSHNCGEDAHFNWRYRLTDDDEKALSQVVFGVYRGGKYKPLCVVQVKNNYTKNFNCSTGVQRLITVMVNVKTSEATFVMHNIDLIDEAVYYIRLVGTLDNMENKTRLVVTDPPKFVEQPTSTTTPEGSTLELTCLVKGKPRPTIKWFKDNETLETNSSESFSIAEVKRGDAGKYHCIAENKVGRILSEPKAMVDVQYPPAINSSKKVNIIRVPIGTDMWLTCPTVANPPAYVQWFANRVLAKSGAEEFQVTVSSSFDYANYTCVAKNPFGQDNITFDLRQVGPPLNPHVDCDKNGDARIIRKFRLYWSSPKYNGGAPVLLYTVKHRSFVSALERNTQEWNIINVTLGTTWYKFNLEWERTFEFTITAWNKYGESKLDLDNTCIITVGKDPAIADKFQTTEMPTKKMVSDFKVFANKNLKNDKTIKNLWLFVGVGVGVFGLTLLLISVYWYRKKTRNDNVLGPKESSNALAIESIMPEGANSHLLQAGADLEFGRTRKQSMVGSPRYQMDPEWYIPREKICILKVIGNGAFGLVYKGRVHGVGPNTLGWNLVAIKSPYADASEAEVRDLMKEFEIMKTLKPHPHVIKLLGYGEDEGRPLVIIEYVPFGDLLGYLRKSRGESDDYYSDPEIKPNTNLSSQKLLRFAWHTADGMAYLASQKILHRDLAARNVLVGDGLSCKVTDFGMAKDVSIDDVYIRSTEGRLPVKWTAIEALTGGGEYTTQSDVWSFGVVLYEICTIGGDPFPGIAAKEIPQHIEEGNRMKRPGHIDPELYDVMMSCWETDPDDRPTFPKLKETLIKLEEVQSRDYINLTECLYQNVRGPATPGSLRRAGKQGRAKDSVRVNSYHIHPGTRAHATAV